jgi:exopolysaccharide biosynthesis polyprenyl glycosylphosphotransferase
MNVVLDEGMTRGGGASFAPQSRLLRRAAMPVDLGATVVAYLAAYGLRQALVPGDPIDFLPHVATLPVIVFLWAVLLPLFGTYGSPRTTSALGYASALARAIGTGVAALLVLFFLLKLQDLSRAVVVIFVAFDIAALLAVRLGIRRYFRRSLRRLQNFRKVLIVGTGNRAARLAEALIRRSEWGIHIVGHLDTDPARVGQRVLGAPVLGTPDDITSILRDGVIDQVILATPRGMIGQVEKVARACEEEGISLCMMADIFDVRVARMSLAPFGAIPLLTFDPVAQDESKLLVKRMMDLAIVGLALPVVLPVTGLIALAIKLDSRGPVFFIQERVGLVKRRFRMFKFRTMVDGAERMQAQVEHLNEASGPIFKIANDPRVTRVGHFLRRTSLDELPQIFNILRGQMSLVGPRPMSLRDVQLFDRGIQRKRFSVKPGLTCVWQVSGRSLLPFSKWLELDLYYIENWSLGLDLKILLRTIPVVLRGTGAV